MDLIKEVCDHLKTISQLLVSSDENTLKEVENKVGVLCENQFNNFANVYQTIESDVNQLKSDSNLSEESKAWIRSVDAMIRCLVLLNTTGDLDMISSQHFFAIKLNVIKLVSLTIIPYISEHFQQIQHLFLSVDIKSMPISDKRLLSSQFVYNLTKLYITFIDAKSIVSRIVVEDCFAPLMASLITLKNDSQSDDQKVTIGEELSQLIASANHMIVIRNLLLLSRCKATKWANNEISRYLSQCLIAESGLNNLINSVLDCDQTSERQTTINQRSQAIGTIVSAIPQLCCSLRQYYCSIGAQVLDILQNTDRNYQRIGSMIVQSLEKRNTKLTKELIIDKIFSPFLTPQTNSSLTLNNCLTVIHNLIVCRYDCKKFIPIISHLFYCRVILEDSVSHYKTLLNDIITEILQSTKSSVYLLDDILYNNYQLINSYQICVVNDEIGIRQKEKDIASQSSSSVCDDQEFSLKQTDSIVQFVIFLLNKMSESFRIDLFLILIERMTFNRPSLLTCSLVDSIHESVSNILSNYTEKSIRFVINTFERVTEELNQEVVINSVDDIENQSSDELNEMKRNSVVMCLQILQILIKEKHKLKDQDISELKQLSPTLDTLSRNHLFEESLRQTAKEVKNSIDLYESSHQFCSDANQNRNQFESAMADLNDPLMPVRAHGLIQLKQLIYAKDKCLLDNKPLLINALKSCLNDSESYIYLSAVNTLSTFAIISTDEVLPILMQEFVDSQRTIEERLKVGEVLVRLSKSIGDFGHHYSKQYMTCFLTGVKSAEPAIRVSSLSNLGQFCSNLRFALKPFIVELLSCVEALLKTDPSLEVKRSSVMLLFLVLKGIDKDVIEAVDQQLKEIYRLLRHIYGTTIDDVLQLHTQLAIEEIDRIVRQLLTPDNQLVKNIKVLAL